MTCLGFLVLLVLVLSVSCSYGFVSLGCFDSEVLFLPVALAYCCCCCVSMVSGCVGFALRRRRRRGNSSLYMEFPVVGITGGGIKPLASATRASGERLKPPTLSFEVLFS